jgi:uncharacterized membrane protein YcaP (DUF421 family)
MLVPPQQHPIFFFEGWTPVLRILLVGSIAYVSLLVMLRVAGKRTIAKMNVFDFVMTVAIGSTLANVLTTAQFSLVDAFAAFVVLIGLQFVFAWAAAHSHRVERLLNGRPELLFYRGHFRLDTMRRERVTEEEVRAAIRAAGAPRLEEVDAVVLETDGVFSVLRGMEDGAATALADVRGTGDEDPARARDALDRGTSEAERREDPVVPAKRAEMDERVRRLGPESAADAERPSPAAPPERASQERASQSKNVQHPG